MIKVLYVLGGPFDLGGISSFVINTFRNINHDLVLIDFAITGETKGIYDNEVLSKGSTIFHIPQNSKHPFLRRKILSEILKNGKYDIIHCHLDAGNYPVLKIAKNQCINVRIAHSHNTGVLSKNPLKVLINEYYRKRMRKVATHCFACSDDAGRWLFESGPYYVVNNSIELDKYSFNNENRFALRKEFNLESNKVIGHIGRFDYQKNHKFLLNVFKKVLEKDDSFRLVLVGDGFLKNTIEKKTIELGIKPFVIFLGKRDDVNQIYNMFDVFVLPSLFEGAGFVAIEAQANGLPVFLSDKVPLSTKLIDSTHHLPLLEEIWVESLLSGQYSRTNSISIIKKKGFDVSDGTKTIESFYLSFIKK